jgi:hypothetical protein
MGWSWVAKTEMAARLRHAAGHAGPGTVREDAPMASIPYSLRPLLGADPAAVTPEQLAKLIGQVETQQADWKRQLNDDRKTNVDLAIDVAAFANATGGLIVVGLDEDPDDAGRAVAFTGVADPGTLVDRIDSTVRDRVQPPVDYTAVAVDGPDGKPVVLIAIEASESSPHCATDGKARIYPVRSGAGKGYLSEAEIAEWYGRRLRRITAQDARTDELRAAAVPDDLLGPADVAWLIVTLTPGRPGSGRVRPGDVDRYRELLAKEVLKLIGDQHLPWNLRVGHRSLVASDFGDPPQQRAVLAADGSGSAAYRWDGHRDHGGTVYHLLTYITWELTWLLSTLVANAIERGAAGGATVSVEVRARPQIQVRVGTGVDNQRPFLIEDLPLHDATTPVSRVTIDLEAATTMRGLLATVHLVGSDLVSTFGYSELPAVTADGDLRPRHLNLPPTDSRVVDWAERRGVDIVE